METKTGFEILFSSHQSMFYQLTGFKHSDKPELYFQFLNAYFSHSLLTKINQIEIALKDKGLLPKD